MSTSVMIQDPRWTSTYTVSTAAAATGPIIDQGGYKLAAIDMSTAWTTGAITFLGGNDTAAMYSIYNDTAEVSISSVLAATLGSIALRADVQAALGAHRYIQLRSGTSTAVSTQSTTRALTLTFVPL